MSEHTDKASQKPRKAPAGKRAPRKARPTAAHSASSGRKAAKDKAREESAPAKAAPAKPAETKTAPPQKNTANKAAEPLAPDPATVVFGSNRPIVAPPPPKPVSSGLRFSGPSNGTLKSSGPQATSPKAEGLTFTSAGNEAAEAASAPAKTGGTSAPEGKQTSQAKTGQTAGAKTKPEPAKAKAQALPGATTPAGKQDSSKAKTPGKVSGVTKPAIAPQNHGRLIEKEPSRGPMALIALGIVTVAVVWWLANQPLTEIAGGEGTAGGEQASGVNPLPGTTGDAAPAPAEQTGALLTVAELREVRDLLVKIGLDAGADSAEITETTRAAIRDYQTMAGLPVDGEATPALLEDLRTVAALYGN